MDFGFAARKSLDTRAYISKVRPLQMHLSFEFKMEDVFVKEFLIAPSTPYFKLVARIYRRGDMYIMNMLSTNKDRVSGEEITTLCCSLTPPELESFHNYIDMIAQFVCVEEPKEGMHLDFISYCFEIESTFVTNRVICIQ